MKTFHWGPALLGLGALAAGAAVMGGLLTFKKTPAEATVARDEKPVFVEAMTVQPADVPVMIEGYGQVHALRTVSITPEVSGRVIAVHPNLIVGGQIEAGTVLFEIDPRPYEARVADAEAQVQGQQNALQRLTAEEHNLEADRKDLARQLELAAGAHARAEQLHKQGVGSQAAVDQAEQTLVTARNEHDRVSRELALYPIRRSEAGSECQSAAARLKLAQVDLERTRVVAPFDARVKKKSLEVGEVVGAGSEVATLVDDSILEIPVPLNSQDARQWLQFVGAAGAGDGWFGALAPVTCAIRWTEGGDGRAWEGTLNRVEMYDEEARTLTVVVRVEGTQRHTGPDRFPLVDGMFCSVRIPGHEMKGVYALPSHAVSFEDTVYLAAGERLKTVPVSVVRIEDEFTYVSDGLSPGDQVIVTRLVNPLDNTLLDVTVQEPGAAR